MTAKQERELQFLCNPENALKCEDCPRNYDFSSWPGHRLPCGDFDCCIADDEDE